MRIKFLFFSSVLLLVQAPANPLRRTERSLSRIGPAMLEPFGPERRVISASRRTDIPAFFPEWLARRLEAGWVLVPSAFGAEPRRVSLAPSDVHGLVLWSKNPAPLLPLWDRIQARCANLFLHFTITGLPRILEPGAPDWPRAAATFLDLARRLSPDHMAWRFDPICILDGHGPDDVAARFLDLARTLEGSARRCVVSFVQDYAKSRRNLARAGVGLHTLPLPEQAALAARLAAIGREHGVELSACCCPGARAGGLPQARCIDGPLLARLWNAPVLAGLKPAPTRPECGCGQALDIGAYGTCGHGCLYCYATTDHRDAAWSARGQDPGAPIQGTPLVAD